MDFYIIFVSVLGSFKFDDTARETVAIVLTIVNAALVIAVLVVPIIMGVSAAVTMFKGFKIKKGLEQAIKMKVTVDKKAPRYNELMKRFGYDNVMDFGNEPIPVEVKIPKKVFVSKSSKEQIDACCVYAPNSAESK